MRICQFMVLFLVTVLGFLSSGCSTTISIGRPPQPSAESDTATPQSDARVNFDDPLLNSRKILLFGPIDQQAAEVAIQKLLFLDGKGHEPIDVFLETPGGDLKHAWVIQQTMRLIDSLAETQGGNV